ncbi:MAG: hypothetical protein L6Q99_05230 [Planctomycetes bacterium]|nr:hypothetical protein [Planctomycetota bacterium]
MTSKKTKAAKANQPTDGLTLGLLADAYAAEMEKQGKSPGTCASYLMELRVALDEIGADIPLREVTPERVGEFFASDRVNKLKSGRAKSPLSIAKTQRVLRLSLVFAEQQGWVEKAPLPEAKPEPRTAAVA